MSNTVWPFETHEMFNKGTVTGWSGWQSVRPTSIWMHLCPMAGHTLPRQMELKLATVVTRLCFSCAPTINPPPRTRIEPALSFSIPEVKHGVPGALWSPRAQDTEMPRQTAQEPATLLNLTFRSLLGSHWAAFAFADISVRQDPLCITVQALQIS